MLWFLLNIRKQNICYTFARVVVIAVLPAPKSNLDHDMSSFWFRVDQIWHNLLELSVNTFALSKTSNF